MKKLIVDLDGTITLSNTKDYKKVLPNLDLIKKLSEYQSLGFEIVICTARNMKTYNNNLGKININTLPTILDWLNQNNVPYDEILLGKPWCGEDGFYIDDQAIRPSEFVSLTQKEIYNIIK